MNRVWPLSFIIFALILTGCASTAGKIPAYQQVDLTKDLDPSALNRYQAETKQVRDSGANCHMATLEKTNWWPLGLIAFWNRGSVETMPGQDGQIYYMASQTRGYGPLSIVYVSKEDATYDAKGKLLTDMSMSSVAWGHLAMFHDVRSRLDSETWMSHWTAHLLHHIISISQMNDMVGVSLFSAPNPIGYGD
jgi:hypothetical protein